MAAARAPEAGAPKAAPKAPPPLHAASEASAAQPVSAVNGQLVGVDGKPLSIRGVNWCARSLLARTWLLRVSAYSVMALERMRHSTA